MAAAPNSLERPKSLFVRRPLIMAARRRTEFTVFGHPPNKSCRTRRFFLRCHCFFRFLHSDQYSRSWLPDTHRPWSTFTLNISCLTSYPLVHNFCLTPGVTIVVFLPFNEFFGFFVGLPVFMWFYERAHPWLNESNFQVDIVNWYFLRPLI